MNLKFLVQNLPELLAHVGDLLLVEPGIEQIQSIFLPAKSNGPDVFASYDAELGLAPTPTALVDRLNLLLMAGQMSSTLEGEIVSAVSAIDIPTGDQNAINAALAARVQTAVYLTLASPDFTAQQ